MIPTALGRFIVTVPEVTSIVKSSSVTLYVEDTPVKGTVIPPKLKSPFLTINSFAIRFFFFHFPKEKSYVFYFINKYVVIGLCKFFLVVFS